MLSDNYINLLLNNINTIQLAVQDSGGRVNFTESSYAAVMDCLAKNNIELTAKYKGAKHA